MKKLIFLSISFLALISLNAFSKSNLRLQPENDLPQNPTTFKAYGPGETEFECKNGGCECWGAKDCIDLKKLVPLCHNWDCSKTSCTCEL